MNTPQQQDSAPKGSGRNLHLRLPSEMLAALDAEAAEEGLTRSAVAKRAIRRGMRQREHGAAS